MHQVLINGKWQNSESSDTFVAADPKAGQPLEDQFPISSWTDIENALASADQAFVKLRSMDATRIADFLETYADGLEAESESLRAIAHQETALPLDTRLVGELARTTGQLRQAAEAARSMSWTRPTIDSVNNIRSCLAPLGPVAVFGPNNFPLAFGSISGGDFAAAIAAGNPVIAKANPMHPLTTKMLAEVAQRAAETAGMPDGTVQLLYHMDYADGEKMIRDSRLGAVAFTGSRNGGLALKRVADEVGKPIYLELSSVNPVVILPGAVEESGKKIAEELTGSCVLGAGQFCTNPGLVIVRAGDSAESFIQATADLMAESPIGTLFSESGQSSLNSSIQNLQAAGAQLVVGGEAGGGDGFSHANTVLRVQGDSFLQNPTELQAEAFGPSTLFVVVDSVEQTIEVVDQLEGNLTGCFYSATDGSDDRDYDQIGPHLQQKVGRLINDKMPTGVAVSPAMNHGGPFPATSHPGFTAVGIPASLTRFGMLQCFDNVRPHRLPKVLQDQNPGGVWRLIDGAWTERDV
ncbi:MAG: aldehyde dehydrogenase (NADP(+)) [Planctomycetota bacterium]